MTEFLVIMGILTLVIVFLMVFIVFRESKHDKMITGLIDRHMSRDFPEFIQGDTVREKTRKAPTPPKEKEPKFVKLG